MSAKRNTVASSSQISQWIWTLAGCAIAGGVLVLALVIGHCLRAEDNAEVVGAQRHKLHRITDELDPALLTLTKTHRGLFRRLNSTPTSSPTELRWSPGAQRISDLPTAMRSQLESLDGEFTAAVDEVAACRRWRGRLDHAVEARRTARQRTEASLHRMQGHVQQLLSSVTPQADATRRQLEHALHQLDKQIVLIGQQSGDRPSAKLGQQMTSTLGFVDSALDDLHRDAGEQAVAELRSDQRALQLALLGSQTSLSTSLTRTGFIETHQAWLQCNTDGVHLDGSLGDRITGLQHGRAKLDQLMGDALAAAHTSVQDRVRNLWLTCLAIGLVILALVLILVTSITRRAREQVSDLIEAERDAGETARAQARFLASMSHEIRTPMNGVLGMAELLEGSDHLSEEHKRQARTIRSSAEALLTVINDVLDFSKIQAGKLELEDTEFDLRDVVNESLKLLGGLATDRGNRLSHHVDRQVPTLLHGDPGRLRQILLNLTGNAIKFTKDGEVEVRVAVKNAHRDIVVLETTVVDTGVGMTDQAQSGLFKSFSQVGTTNSQRVAGTGLGLTISKQLIQLMGGDISVHSESGVGSTFTFSLTLKRGHPQKAADFSGRNVLIVSDDRASWQQLALHLLPWKLGIEVAESTTVALDLLRASRAFDLCLLDLPHAESLELADRIATDPALKSTRCMVFSAEQTPPAEHTAVEAWLTKPVDGDGLAQCLHSILGNNGAPTSNGHSAATTDGPLDYRVLVAEDNAINQRVLAEILRRLGCTARFADNGVEALDRIREATYDVVLMDCQMPEMDGFAATRAIREMPGLRSLPIIALTANVMPADRRECEQAGMNDFLSKPVRKDQLRETLVRWASAHSR